MSAFTQRRIVTPFSSKCNKNQTRAFSSSQNVWNKQIIGENLRVFPYKSGDPREIRTPDPLLKRRFSEHLTLNKTAYL